MTDPHPPGIPPSASTEHMELQPRRPPPVASHTSRPPSAMGGPMAGAPPTGAAPPRPGSSMGGGPPPPSTGAGHPSQPSRPQSTGPVPPPLTKAQQAWQASVSPTRQRAAQVQTLLAFCPLIALHLQLRVTSLVKWTSL